MRLRTCAQLAVAAGALLMLANVRGGSLLLEAGDQLARRYLAPELAQPVHLTVTVLLFVASLGGLAVMAGGLLYWKRMVRLGSLVIGLGAGIGILGLAVLLLVSIATTEAASLMAWLLGPAGAGVVLSIVARRGAKDAAY